MPSPSRWLTWTPLNEEGLVLTGDKTDKTGETDGETGSHGPFVSFVSVSSGMDACETENAEPSPESPEDLPEPIWDIGGYAKDFGRWALAHCVFRDRCWGGVAVLHREWEEWCFLEDVVPANLLTFRALLEDKGFTLTERGTVYGLLLPED